MVYQNTVFYQLVATEPILYKIDHCTTILSPVKILYFIILELMIVPEKIEFQCHGLRNAACGQLYAEFKAGTIHYELYFRTKNCQQVLAMDKIECPEEKSALCTLLTRLLRRIPIKLALHAPIVRLTTDKFSIFSGEFCIMKKIF